MKKEPFFISLTICCNRTQSAAGQKKYKAYIVSNSHLDTQWNWDVQTTIDEYLSIHWSETSICFSIIPIMYLTLKAEEIQLDERILPA